MENLSDTKLHKETLAKKRKPEKTKYQWMSDVNIPVTYLQCQGQDTISLMLFFFLLNNKRMWKNIFQTDDVINNDTE